MEIGMSDGILYHGDCLDVLRAFPDACVDLIYLDPPFNSNRDFFGRDGNIAFRDRWRWDEQARREAASLEKTLSGTPGEALMPALHSLLGESGMAAYLVLMANRLTELRRVLKGTGNLYLHCDPTASHYLKAVLDAIFGGRNFRNEIIWKRSVSKNLARRNFAASHDVLFRYAKTKGARFTAQHIPHDPEYARKRFGYRDADGRRYRLDDLTNPARNRPNLTYEFLGVTRVWRWTRERMMKAWENGRIVLRSPGAVPRYKVWLEDCPGKAVGDVWDDISPLWGHAEYLGYPTQKPVALLERVILASSNPGDVVLDPFCGTGTTLHAAQKLGRRWAGIDKEPLALSVASRRMRAAFPECVFARGESVDCEPYERLRQA